MGDYAVKGSLSGYDISAVVDYLLSFNSGWPLLKIEASGAGSITLNGTPQTIYTHNLGYRPFHLIINKDLVVGGGLLETFSGLNKGVGTSTTALAYDGSNSFGGTFSFYYYIFRLDLTQAYTAPSVTGSTTQNTQNDNYVFKVTKPGKDVASTDMRDFSIHSNTRSPMLHQVDYGFADTLSGGYALRTVTHNLGFTPLAFCFIKWTANTLGHDNDWIYSVPPTVGVTAADYTVSSTSVVSRTDTTYTSLTVPNISTVILKDPFTKETISRTFP